MSKGYRPIIRYRMRRGLPSRAGFSRRDVLKAGLGAAAGAMLAPTLGGCSQRSLARTDRRAQGLSVIVIGAGFAGLACADTLSRSGARVTVLESTSRPGGRVLTDRKFIPGRTVELGAEFIGENHPTAIRYARRFNLPLVEAEEYEFEDGIIINGELIRGAAADEISGEIDSTLATFIDMAQPIDPVRPWTSPNAEQLDAQTMAQLIDSMRISDRAKRLVAAIEEADSGVPPSRMSMLGYLAMVAGGGFQLFYEASETHRVDGGNDRIATSLARSLGQRVRYRQQVVAIDRSADAATVRTADGGSFTADAVVLAIPPSVWHKIAFNTHEVREIPQMGSNVKLVLKLDRPVWEQHNLTPELRSDGLAAMTWISATARQGAPLSLTLFSGGKQSEALRKMDAGQRRHNAVASLAPAYPDLAAAVTQDLFMDWPSMPHALASYSFPAPGEVLRYGPTLVDGLDDGLAPLRFAGEHTSYGFIGYMEGALSSGVRTAEALIAARAPMTA